MSFLQLGISKNSHREEISNIEALADIQHYGGKTRLLDFTHSISVALFFAFENSFLTKERCIWCINYKALINSLHLPYSKVLGKCKITSKKAIELTDDDRERISDEVFKQYVSNHFNANALFLNEANKCIFNEEDCSVCCEDRLLPLEMPGRNSRLDAQAGLFLFQTRLNSAFERDLLSQLEIKNKEENFDKDTQYCGKKGIRTKLIRYKLMNAKIIKIIFNENFRQDKKILDMLNINPYVIYPDKIGIAKSITYWGELM